MNAILHSNPWEIPDRFIATVPDDHFIDVHAEEAVLAHMLWKNKQSKRLDARDFTSADRQLIFTAIQEGAPYETIERLELDLPGYVTDLFFAPSNAPGYLREAVEQVLRLSELRRLRDKVRAWERKAATMPISKARVALAECLK